MDALPNDLAKVRESLAELRMRFPAAAMDGLDQLLEAYLALLSDDPAGRDRAATGGARQGALWAARRVLLRFFPSNRVECDGDDCSPEAVAAYAGFARALDQQARRDAHGAEGPGGGGVGTGATAGSSSAPARAGAVIIVVAAIAAATLKTFFIVMSLSDVANALCSAPEKLTVEFPVWFNTRRITPS